MLADCFTQASAQQPGVVKIADGTPFYDHPRRQTVRAAKGVKLLAGDFIETQPGSFTVADLPASTVVALGPSTRFVRIGSRRLDVVVRARIGLNWMRTPPAKGCRAGPLPCSWSHRAAGRIRLGNLRRTTGTRCSKSQA